jgi:hypothetical protein
MFEPVPEPKISSSNYLRWKDVPVSGTDSKGNNIKKVRLRLMGSTKIPGSLLQCWTAWEEYQEVDETTGKMVTNSRPHREEYSKAPSQYLKDLDKDKNPKSAWNLIAWHVEDERPLVWEITQSSIKDAILLLANNPLWGGEDENKKPLKDVSRFVIEVSKTGEKFETVYSVNPEPPAGPAPKKIVDEVKDAMIDVRVLVNDENNGDPFGALNMMPATTVTNDQVNIKELREAGEPIPMGKEESLSSVGSITRDAIETLKAAHDKASAVAPEMKDGMPY